MVCHRRGTDGRELITAVDATSGAARWNVPVGEAHDGSNNCLGRDTPAAVADGRVHVPVQGDAVYVGGQFSHKDGDPRRSLFRYTTGSGEHRWSVEPDPNPGSQVSFTIAGGALVVGTAEFRAESGAVMGIW